MKTKIIWGAMDTRRGETKTLKTSKTSSETFTNSSNMIEHLFKLPFHKIHIDQNTKFSIFKPLWILREGRRTYKTLQKGKNQCNFEESCRQNKRKNNALGSIGEFKNIFRDLKLPTKHLETLPVFI